MKFTGSTYDLTKTFIESLPYAEHRKKRVIQKLYWDKHDHGLGLLVGLGSKTFVCQRSVDGRSVRETLGRFGDKGITVTQARKLYRERFAALERGEGRVPRITLRQAWENIYKPMLEAKRRQPGTAGRYEYTLNFYFRDWMDKKLASIDGGQVLARHQQIAKDVKKRKGTNGEASANQAIKIFGLVYRRAARQHPKLPAPPTLNVDPFVRDESSRRPIPDDQVPVWFKAVRALDNKVVADALEFAAFSGMRKTSILEMRWEHVDWKRNVLHVPRPKGGSKAKFDLPLSDQLGAILRRREKEHSLYAAGAEKSKPWVWPSPSSASGHLYALKAQVPGADSHTLHELRNTFASVAARYAKLDEMTIGTILNHRQPKQTVTQHYMATNVADLVEHLRPPMQAAASAIERLADGSPGRNVVQMRQRRAEAK